MSSSSSPFVICANWLCVTACCFRDSGVGASIPVDDGGNAKGPSTTPPGCARIFLYPSVMALTCAVPKPRLFVFLFPSTSSSSSLSRSGLGFVVTATASWLLPSLIRALLLVGCARVVVLGRLLMKSLGETESTSIEVLGRAIRCDGLCLVPGLVVDMAPIGLGVGIGAAPDISTSGFGACCEALSSLSVLCKGSFSWVE